VRIVALGEAAFTGSSGRTVWQVDGSNGSENRIRIEGATPVEVWHRAVQAVAAYVMVAHWPRPSG